MRILIDADGCPVIDIAIKAAMRFCIECILLCDDAHVFDKPYARTMTFSKGRDSVDFALVNLLEPGDVVVTQDYGLAAMCLARGAYTLNQDAMAYTHDNIDTLLSSRYTAMRARRAGVRMRGPKKRTREQDAAFESGLDELLRAKLTPQTPLTHT